MRVEPAAAELLEVAREAILAEIAPSLPESRRYAALMAANALAIASRDLEAPDDGAAELARLAVLLPRLAPGGEPACALREATARLASAIREGQVYRSGMGGVCFACRLCKARLHPGRFYISQPDPG